MKDVRNIYKKLTTISIILFFIFYFSGCGKFKTERLKYTELFKLHWGSNLGELGYAGNREDISQIPFEVKFYKDEIFIVDKINCRIQKFDKHGKLLLSIDRKDTQFDKMSMDNEGNIYSVQILSGAEDFAESTPVYTINKFDKNGNFLSNFSNRKYNYISEIFFDKNNDVTIITKNDEDWKVYKYKKECEVSVYSNANFLDSIQIENYTLSIQNIQATYDGKSLVYNVAYFKNGIEFEYYKYILFDLILGKIKKILFKKSDITAQFVRLSKDNIIYKWRTLKNNQIKLTLLTFWGGTITNKLITLKDNIRGWMKIDISYDNIIYGVAVGSDISFFVFSI